MSEREARPSRERRNGGPLLLAVADDEKVLGDVQRELENRYVPDYRVCCLASGQRLARH